MLQDNKQIRHHQEGGKEKFKHSYDCKKKKKKTCNKHSELSNQKKREQRTFKKSIQEYLKKLNKN